MSIIKAIAAGGAILATPFVQRQGERLVDHMVDKYVGDKVAGALDKTISTIFSAWKAGHGAGQTLVSASQAVRVEPYVLVDARASRLPFTKDVMNVAQRLYTSYYMLAQAADNTIDGVRVSKRLDKFATDPSLRDTTIEFLSSESYQFGLPFVGEAAGLQRWSGYSTEASNPAQGNGKDEPKPVEVSTGFATSKVAVDVSNLAVGQVVDVTITNGVQKAVVQVAIKLRPIGMASTALSELIAYGGEDNSFRARILRWKVGELELWRDVVMEQDRVRRYRQAAMADKNGYLRKAIGRDNRGMMNSVLSGQPSIGTATSIAIVTKETIREAEEKMNGRISDFATRQAIFDQGMMMMMFVLDADTETVTIYTRDIEDYGIYTLRDLKAAGAQSSNGDLADIMKSYLEGRVPGRL